MNVITEQSASPSFVPEAVVNVYQGINAITRIFRKTCENTEAVTDVAFSVMQLTLEAQKSQLLARQNQTLTIA